MNYAHDLNMNRINDCPCLFSGYIYNALNSFLIRMGFKINFVNPKVSARMHVLESNDLGMQ